MAASLILSLAVGVAAYPAKWRNSQSSQLQSTKNTQETQGVHTLTAGNPVRRELSPGQSHAYQITLNEGQYLKILIKKQGIDITSKFYGPEGKEIGISDVDDTLDGEEKLCVDVSATGLYRLVVTSTRPNVPAGRYDIKIARLYAPSEKERAFKLASGLYSFYKGYATDADDLARAKETLTLLEKTQGPESPDVVRLLYGLTEFYRKKKEFESAELLLQRALAIQEKRWGPNHPDVSIALEALAILYQDKGETAKAQQMKNRSQELWEKALAPVHPDIRSFLDHLSNISNIKDRTARVEQTLQDLMAIQERVQGADHPETAAFLSYMADYYRERGQHEKAEPLFQRAVAIQETIQGKDHPDTSMTLGKLAILYTETNEKIKAETIAERIVEIRERIFGCAPQFSFDIFYNGEGFQRVEDLLQRMVSMSEKRFGAKHENMLNLFNIAGDICKNAMKWEDSRSFYRRAVTIAEQTYGPDHLGVIESLTGLTDVRGYVSDEEKQKLHQRILKIRENSLGPDHLDVAESLDALSDLIEDDKQAAKKMTQRALSIREKSLGAEHPGITESLDKLGGVLMEEGDHAGAEALYRRALAIREKSFEPGHKEIMGSYYHLFMLYTFNGEYEKARPILERVREFSSKNSNVRVSDGFQNLLVNAFMFFAATMAYGAGEYGMAEGLFTMMLMISEQTEGKDGQMGLAVTRFLALVYTARGEYDRAETLLQDRLSLLEKKPETTQPTIAFATRDLALLHRKKGEYAKAKSLFRRGLEIINSVYGPQHPATAIYLVDLADLSLAEGNDEEADKRYQEALKIIESDSTLESSNLTFFLRKYAAFNSQKEDYKTAEKLLQRVLSILDKNHSSETLDLAFTLGDLADLHIANGEYAKAGPLLERARKIWKKELEGNEWAMARTTDLMGIGGEDINPVIDTVLERHKLEDDIKPFDPERLGSSHSLRRLARALTTRGEYEAAESLFLQAWESSKKNSRGEHPEVADTLVGLADLYNRKGEYQKAEERLHEALKIQEKSFGKEHSEVVSPLTSLAIVYCNQGEYEKAEPLLRRALDVSEKTLGPEHRYVTKSISALASVVIAKGDFDGAEPLLRRASEIQEKSLGPNHIEVAQSLEPLMHLYVAKGDLSRAISLGRRIAAIIERNLKINLAAGSESQKLNFLATLANDVNNLISLHAHSAPADLDAMKLAVGVLLQNKGRVLEDLANSVGAMRAKANSSDQALFDRLSESQSKLAALIFRRPKKLSSAAYQNEIKKLEEQVEKLQAELGVRSLEYRAQMQPVTLEAVTAAIPMDAALVEFAVYRPFNQSLATAQNSSQDLHYIAYVLRRNSEVQWLDLGEAKPIEKAIDVLRQSLSNPEKKGIEVHARALDEMVMRPIRPLLGDSSRVLISADGNLNLIPFEALMDEKGRFLIEHYAFTYLSSGRDLLRLQASREGKGAPLILADPEYGKVSLSASGFYDLEGSLKESKSIKSHFPSARVLTGIRATEGALKKADAPMILHVATHGFFLEDQPFKIEKSSSLAWMQKGSYGSEFGKSVKVVNPLLRSGLALAGANQRKDKNGDDGILTGLEFAGLNLWGTKLVVLSACDTGVGQIRNGEGVYGLRRALILAGSETQVISLWRISDGVTPRLVNDYYNGLKMGKGRGEALRQAQLKMLKQASLNHPYYWAAFIQSGEWANLDGVR